MKLDTLILAAQAVIQVENEGLPLVVYLRLRTVSITLTSKVLDVLDVLDPGGGGGGSDFPPVGMSPAKIEVDSAHMSASAIANRFMDVAPLRFEKDAEIST